MAQGSAEFDSAISDSTDGANTNLRSPVLKHKKLMRFFLAQVERMLFAISRERKYDDIGPPKYEKTSQRNLVAVSAKTQKSGKTGRLFFECWR